MTTTTLAPPATTTSTIPPRDACGAVSDAAKAASAVFYANTSGRYPVSFPNLTTSHPPTLELPAGVTASATTLTGAGWTLTMAGGGGTNAPTFACHFG